MAYVDGKVSLKQLLTNWGLVFVGNFVGALGILVLIYLSGHWQIGGGAVGAKVLAIANAKVNMTWVEAFTRGMLCNILVCMAVWLCFAGRTVVDKVLAILFPITAFVALGFEHSVANMYFIPLAIFHGGVEISMQDFAYNLVPVTIGNIIGGSIFVALVYWISYIKVVVKK